MKSKMYQVLKTLVDISVKIKYSSIVDKILQTVVEAFIM